MESHRRAFLVSAFGAAGLGTAFSLGAGEEEKAKGDKKSTNKNQNQEEGEISAPEDLMREHGLLNRILLVYEEGLRRIHANREVAPEVFRRPADLVRRFVEDYHERL